MLVGDRDRVGQVAAVPAVAGLDEVLLGLDAVDHRVAVVDRQPVAWPRHDPLDEVGVRRLRRRLGTWPPEGWLRAALLPVGSNRRVKDDDVADRGIGELVDDPVDEHPLPRVQSGLHRARGDLVRLDDEGLDQQREPDRQRDDHHQLEERPAPGRGLGDQACTPRAQEDSSEPLAFASGSDPRILTAESPDSSGAPRTSSPPRPRPRPLPLKTPRPPPLHLPGLPPPSLPLPLRRPGAIPPRSEPRPRSRPLRCRARHHQLVLDPPAPLGDLGPPAHPPAQVVELRPSHVSLGDHLEPVDLGGVHREGPLHADPERLLSHRERLASAGAAAGDHHALEDLRALSAALDDLEVDAHPVARRNRGTRLSWRCSMLSMIVLMGSRSRADAWASAAPDWADGWAGKREPAGRAAGAY